MAPTKQTDTNTLSILGSGWLGLPLIKLFILNGCHVKASTTSEGRLTLLSRLGAEPYELHIEKLTNGIQEFLRSRNLIINIPSKNIEAYQNLIREIERSEIERVLFVSSISIYSNCAKTILESDGVELPDHPLTKIEKHFARNEHFETTIVRFGGLIGYDRHPGKFFRDGKVLKEPGAKVNLIHRDDCVNIIGQIIENDIWGGAYNCCADTHPSKREFYSLAAVQLGEPIPKLEAEGEQAFKIVSNRKIKKALNYEFKYPDLMDIEFDLNISK